MDLGEELVINDEDIIRGKLLGRGAFGFVFKGVCKGKKPGNSIQIAIKMLQPVPPGPNSSQSAVIAYKVNCFKHLNFILVIILLFSYFLLGSSSKVGP